MRPSDRLSTDMTKGPLNSPPIWHLLQVSDVLDLELATALSVSVPVIAWEPERTIRALSMRPGSETERIVPDTSLRVRKLPLLRGFSRFPISVLSSLGPAVVDRLLSQTEKPEESPLICTVPYFAEVAERWPGPVIYWLTDLIAEYTGANRKQVIELDRRLCRVATLVCPNSVRLGRYLVESADCEPERIEIIPNATREMNILMEAPTTRAADHPALRGIARPIAGVIGNLALNMDWHLIEGMIEQSPSFSWVFVGPSSMAMPVQSQREARSRVLKHPRAHFVGPKPYGDLAGFARAFDVAILPYKRCEPTYSGSSTRFYEHLAAARPMLATCGLEELTRKPPLLRLIGTAEDGAAALAELAAQEFDDGYIGVRWRTSQQNTWKTRAESIQSALAERLSPASPLPIAM